MSGGERALKGEYRDGAAFPFLIKFLMGVRGYFVVIAFTITATEVRQKKGFRAFIAWVGCVRLQETHPVLLCSCDDAR